jgi:hypothetical protein
MIDRNTISAIAAELGVSWHTVNTIAMRATPIWWPRRGRIALPG